MSLPRIPKHFDDSVWHRFFTEMRRQQDSGLWTPTLTNVANAGSLTAYAGMWQRQGDVVTAGGVFAVTPTAATLTRVGLSLPVASSLTSPGGAFEVAGLAMVYYVAGEVAPIIPDATNDRAEVYWTAGSTAARTMVYHFVYRVV